MRRRVAIAFVLCATVCVLVVAEAAAAGPFKACAPGSPLLCARITVPLDRSGAVPGTVNLHVERLRSRGPREGALLALAGGPGEAATPYVFDWAFTLRSALQNRDLVVLDQRGTGLSGVLRCRSLFVPVTRTPLEQAQAAERCAQSLGPRRAHYTTRDSVDDIDAVRRAVGVDKITLFGVSYGTKVALGYAAKYPQHVERLLLDSVVEPAGPGAFSQESLAAVPRILRALCARGCEQITKDLPADLAALLTSMRGGLLYGPLVAADGRRKRARIGRLRLLELLFAGDFDPTLRAELPGCPAGGARGRHGAVAAARPAKRAGSGPDARPLSERRAVHGDRMRGGSAPVGSHDAGECPGSRGRGERPGAAGRDPRTLRPHHGAVRIRPLPALQPLAHRAHRATVARRALPRGPHARPCGRGRPAHPARVRAPDRVADPGGDAGRRARDGSLGAERVPPPLRHPGCGRLLPRQAGATVRRPTAVLSSTAARFRVRWQRCRPSRRSVAGEAAPSPRSA